MQEDKVKILIIDDDETDRKRLRRLLKRLPALVQIWEAEDSIVGKNLLVQERPDCVFVDYSLPGQDGLQFIQVARADGADVPIILLTGFGSELLAAEAMKNGASDYLPKQHLSEELVLKTLDYVLRIRDVEQKAKAMEQQLKESRERYEALVKQSSEAVTVHQLITGNILDVNKACVHLFGYEENELLKMKWTDLLWRKNGDEAEIKRLLSTAGRYSARTAQYRHKTGGVIFAEHAGSLIEYQDEKLVLVTHRDITPERKLQQQIKEEVLLAGTVQRAMIPAGFVNDEVRICTLYESAHLVSGDFLGYRWAAAEKRLHGYVLDVTGHGMAAALQTSAISSLLNKEMDQFDPWHTENLLRLNRQLTTYFPEGSYAALIAFTLDLQTMTATCVSGGINWLYTFVADRMGRVICPGSYLGLVDDPEYGRITFSLQRGDTLYFLSDGLEERLRADFSDRAVLFDTAMKSLRQAASGEDLRDDCSALCIEVSGGRQYPLYFSFSGHSERRRYQARIVRIIETAAATAAPRIIAALDEAIANSLRFGYTTRIKINRIGRFLVLRIADTGCGFNGNQLLQRLPATEIQQVFADRVQEESGRGIPIMVAWMDRVIYNRQGNEVMLVKRLF